MTRILPLPPRAEAGVGLIMQRSRATFHHLAPPGEASERDKLMLEASEVSLSLLAALRKTGRQAFGPLGFTSLEAMLLVFVGLGYTQPRKLATLLGLVPPALSTKTSQMADAGLLQRESNNEDARRVTITLTDAGIEASQKLMSAWRREQALLAPTKFSDEEIRAFTRVGRSMIPAEPES